MAQEVVSGLVGAIVLHLVKHRMAIGTADLGKPGIPRVAHDRQQPGAGVIVSQRLKRPEGPHRRILHDVLRVRITLRQPTRIVERRVQVRQDDFLKYTVSHRPFFIRLGLHQGYSRVGFSSLQEYIGGPPGLYS